MSRWVTKLKLGKVDAFAVEDVCEDIKQKDDTFDYEVRDDGDILIFSENKDKAFQRGAWMKRKVDFRIFYDVFEEIG